MERNPRLMLTDTNYEEFINYYLEKFSKVSKKEPTEVDPVTNLYYGEILEYTKSAIDGLTEAENVRNKGNVNVWLNFDGKTKKFINFETFPINSAKSE